MYTKLLLMPTRYSAMCSIISFSICIFIRLLLIVISLSHIAKNLNADETNAQQLNANKVESEIADNTEDLYEDSLNTNDTAFLDLSSKKSCRPYMLCHVNKQAHIQRNWLKNKEPLFQDS